MFNQKKFIKDRDTITEISNYSAFNYRELYVQVFFSITSVQVGVPMAAYNTEH